MIFVTTGSAGFDELAKEIDRLSPKLKEKVIINIGYGNYKPKNCEWVGYTDKFEDYVKRADLIITHGGAGTIFPCLKSGKKIIAVPNKSHEDDQSDLVRKLSEGRYLITCENLSSLGKCIGKIRDFKFKKYISPKCEIPDRILEFLGGLNPTPP